MGLPKAEYAVGYFSEVGIGCQKDTSQAVEWYKKAAKNGDKRAIQKLQGKITEEKIPAEKKKSMSQDDCVLINVDIVVACKCGSAEIRLLMSVNLERLNDGSERRKYLHLDAFNLNSLNSHVIHETIASNAAITSNLYNNYQIIASSAFLHIQQSLFYAKLTLLKTRRLKASAE
ncbi:hypothetical protein G6F42_025021 [Rhizopus arrhizus]|nr:hypothetical protein G6F42_025021 [Rhizopus arrhizus]